MVLTPGGGSNRNPGPRNDQRAADVYANGRGSRTLVPSPPVSPGQQGQQEPGQYPGQRPGQRPVPGQRPGYGSGPHSLRGGYGDGRDPYEQGGYGDQGYGGQNGYDGRNGQPGQQGRRDRNDAPQWKKKQQSSAKRRKQLGSDRRTKALPMVPKPVSDGRVAMGRLAIIVTVSAWIAYTVNWFFADFFHPPATRAR
jgi:hypothetical protein